MSRMAELVKAMHRIVLNISDEDAYMSWIWTVPDCPSDEDFENIANDPEMLKDVSELFLRLVKRHTDGKVSVLNGDVYL